MTLIDLCPKTLYRKGQNVTIALQLNHLHQSWTSSLDFHFSALFVMVLLTTNKGEKMKNQGKVSAQIIIHTVIQLRMSEG